MLQIVTEDGVHMDSALSVGRIVSVDMFVVDSGPIEGESNDLEYLNCSEDSLDSVAFDCVAKCDLQVFALFVGKVEGLNFVDNKDSWEENYFVGDLAAADA